MSRGGQDPATPMLQQYRRWKQEYPGTLLLFRLGDFYELFGDDAEIGAAVLGITLTSREIGKGRRFPMCGVPHHSVAGYVAQLVAAGHRVAICEQMEDPRQAKGVVRREVIRVVTPGTLEDESSRDRRYLAAVAVAAHAAAVALADLSTGELRVTRLDASSPPGSTPVQSCVDELRRVAPSEVVLPPGAEEGELGQALSQLVAGPAQTPWETDLWRLDAARRLLLEHFRVASLDAFGIEGEPEAQVAAGVALGYLTQTQKDRLVHITRLERYDPRAGLMVDPTSALNLELVVSLRQRARRGTLLDVIDRTLTAGGGRLLRRYVEEPLADPQAINARLDAVEALVHDFLGRGRLRGMLKGLGDGERALGRCGTGRATPRDLALLGRFVEQGIAVVEHTLRSAASRSEEALGLAQAREHGPALRELAGVLSRAIGDDAWAQPADGGYIRPGYDAELDALREAADRGREFLANLEQRERERTGIRSLKVGYNRVFGYYIEVTKARAGLVPDDYERRQTLADAERFVTPELRGHERRILEAQERMASREAEIFADLVARVLAQATALQALASVVARIDVAVALAEVAAEKGWSRPVVDGSTILRIEKGRHPVVEALAGGEPFVPNDVHLDTGAHRLGIVTGPNMGGKSTFLRQTALVVLLAQMGSFVPAERAHVGVVDRILTRVGASDDLATGRSTFMIEMGESAYILRHVTERSLVVLDEVGRGTATYDGLSLAWAIVEALAEQGCRTLVATHFHELTELEGRLPGVFNLHAAVAQAPGGIAFLKQVLPGAADRSYGLEVARLAGMPEPVVQRAKEILEQLEGNAPGPAEAGPLPAEDLAPSAAAEAKDGRAARPRARAKRAVVELAQGKLF